MGRADLAAMFNFVAYYGKPSHAVSPLRMCVELTKFHFAIVIAIPLGLLVGFVCNWGLHGLWLGVSLSC